VTSQAQPSTQVFVGIDVSQEKLDVARSDTPALLSVGNDAAGHARLARELGGVTVIAVEATGGLEQALCDALVDAGLAVWRVNPKRARDLARGLGVEAKTDAIDARVLAHLAERGAVRLLEKRDQCRVELEALVTCRRQLIDARTAHTNQRSRTASPAARRSVDAVLKTVARQIESLDSQIRKLIEADDDLGRGDGLLRSVPGVGPVLSATLLSELHELGRVSPKRAASLVGLAPYPDDSGKRRGKRRIRGGRASVRNVLYMATLAAMRDNPVIHRFAQHLRGAGKLPKVVIIACARKLLTLLNAMLRENLPWHELNLVKNA